MGQLQWDLTSPKPPPTLCQSPLPSLVGGADHPSSLQPPLLGALRRDRVDLLIHNRTVALEHLQGLGGMLALKPQGHGNQR